MKTTSKKNKKWRQLQQKIKNEDDLKKMKNEDDLKKNQKILIPLKFRGKPFLGLAQLSKILNIINKVDMMDPLVSHWIYLVWPN